MSNIARYAFTLISALACTGLSSNVRCQTKPTLKPSLSSVSGRVTVHEKGAPGILVGIRTGDYSPQPEVALKAITDQDGNYRITDIPPGNYRVSPVAPAYVDADPMVARMNGKSLALASNEDVKGIDFSLLRGGVITGKVKESNGRPIIEERVNLVLEDQSKGREMSSPFMVARFQTDDRGIYRMYGIAPGRYKISIGIGDVRVPSNRPGRVVYKQTFHPAATSADNAAVVEVAEGAEVSNIDITVERSLPGFAVVGKIVDGETGAPAAGVMIGLRRLINDNEVGGGFGGLASSNRRGEFRLENVPPGKYATFTTGRPGNEVLTDRVPLEVVDQEVTGLVVKTLKALTITGNVVLDGTPDKSILAKLLLLQLQAYVRSEGSNFSTGQSSGLGPDGRFRMGALSAGTAHFSLSGRHGDQPSGFAILRVEHNGAVQPRTVELKPGESVTDVRVVVSYGTGSIRGEVLLENGPLPQDARVYVWIKKLGESGPSDRGYNLDARGHFQVEGVAAGSYEVNASVNLPGRRARIMTKQTVQVSDGTTTEVVMTLDLKATPE